MSNLPGIDLVTTDVIESRSRIGRAVLELVEDYAEAEKHLEKLIIERKDKCERKRIYEKI